MSRSFAPCTRRQLDRVYNANIPSSRRVAVMTHWGTAFKSLGGILVLPLITSIYTFGQTRSAPIDPGVRGGPAGAGAPLNGLTADETAFFKDG